MVFQEENADNFIIIDGSSYLYRAFYALPNLKTSSGLNSGAIHGFANMLNRILNEYSPKCLVMVFDAKGKNFRHDIYDEYKACLLYTSPSPRDLMRSRMPSSA